MKQNSDTMESSEIFKKLDTLAISQTLKRLWTHVQNVPRKHNKLLGKMFCVKMSEEGI